MAKPQLGSVRVWVAGPFGLFNQALKELLDGLPGIAFIGQSIDLKARPEVAMDVVLLILIQPANLEIISTFHQQYPDLRVLLLSTEWTPAQARASLQTGAVGCLTADISVGELAEALRQAARGEFVLSPELQRALVLEMANHSTSVSDITYDELSSREREVLELICEGLSNKQIAQRLYLSVRTIENHLRRLYQKLEVSSRTEAAVLAMQHGWVKLP